MIKAFFSVHFRMFVKVSTLRKEWSSREASGNVMSVTFKTNMRWHDVAILPVRDNQARICYLVNYWIDYLLGTCKPSYILRSLSPTESKIDIIWESSPKIKPLIMLGMSKGNIWILFSIPLSSGWPCPRGVCVTVLF